MSQGTEASAELSPIKRALLALEKAKARIAALEQERSEPIAIVGIGCRFPGGVDSPEAFWRFLAAGGDASIEIPADRWDVDAYYDPDPASPGKMYTRSGGFVPEPDRFDAEFFGISPAEARTMDPQQRLLLEVAWESLDHAGLPAERLHGTPTGVFVGIMTNDYTQLTWREPEDINAYTGTGGTFSVTCGRLSYALGLRGPSLAVDTACSSALVALHLACQALRQRECDVALAGGVNRILVPGPHIYMCKMGALSPDGRCFTFDARANGYMRGEGCGVLVLKRLSDALSDGDTIHALVRGSAVNQDGQSAGLTAPSAVAQQEVIRRALASARVEPWQVACVEAHGTATPLGDPIELGVLKDIYGVPVEGAPPCAVASVKTNIGHLEAAAGVAGVIKMVLSMQRGVIPAHLHLRELNPKISLDHSRLFIPQTATAWPAGRRCVGVSAFGFGGTNCHVILEEAPAETSARTSAASTGVGVLPISARSPEALVAMLRAHRDLAGRQDLPPFADACFTAGVRRSHHGHRRALVATSWSDAAHELDELLRDGPALAGERDVVGRPAVAFVFSGQGAQFVAMGRRLLDEEPVFRAAIERCDALARPLVSWSIREALEQDHAGASLAKTEVAQPVLFALQYGLAALWRSWGIEPDTVIGHSVGEVAAACVAGALSVEEALRLAVVRGQIMEAAAREGAMASVSMSREELERELAGMQGAVEVAAVNGPGTTVIAGEPEALRSVTEALRRRGVTCRDLGVSYAFHTRAMDPAGPLMREALAWLRPRKTSIALVSTLTGDAVDGEQLDASYWARQLRNPVLFAPAVRRVLARETRAFVEIGPRPVLAPALADCLLGSGSDALLLASMRPREAEVTTLRKSLARLYALGAAVRWEGVSAAGRCVELPAYAWQRRRFWFEPSVPTRRTARPALAEPSPAPPLPAFAVRWTARARAAEGSDAVGSWLVLSDHDGPGQPLATALAERRGTCVMVTRGGGFERTSSTRFTVDPGDPRHFARVLDEMSREGAPRLRGIVHSWGTRGGAPDVEARALLAGLLHTVQAVGRAGFRDPPRLWVVTKGVHVGCGDEGSLAQAPLWGLGRVLAHEHPELACTCVDLASAGDELAELVAELVAADAEQQVSLQGGVRRVARLASLESAAVRMAFDAEASYLVTGGPLAVIAAHELARRGARSIALAGPLDDAEALASLRGVVDRLEVLDSDLGDATQLDAWWERLRASGFPAIRGVVHAGGGWSEGTVQKLDAELLGRSFAAQAAPAWSVISVASRKPLDFLVVFSSAVSMLGEPGLGPSAAAAAFLDALARRRRAQGGPAMSVAWGPWTDERGVLAAQARLRGFGVASPSGALDALIGWSGAADVHVGIFELNLRHWRQQHPRAAAMPLLSELAQEAAPREATPGSFRDALVAAAPSERRTMLEGHLRDVLARVAMLDPERISPHTPLTSLGLDSFMGVELRNRLETSLGLTLSPTLVYSYPTLAEATTYLAERIGLDLIAGREQDAQPLTQREGSPSEALGQDELEATLEAELAALEQATRRSP